MKSRTLPAAIVGGVILAAAAFGAWTSASQGASGTPPTSAPLSAARFEISIDGHSLALFSEVEGIVSGIDPAELELATRGRKKTELKLPGKRTPPTVTLKRGMTRSLELAAWHELVLAGDMAAARKDVTLTMYSTTGDPVARYNLTDAWPAKLEISALSAGASEVLFETVTLVAESVRRVSV